MCRKLIAKALTARTLIARTLIAGALDVPRIGGRPQSG
jgi:hypothetical protein